MLLIARLLRFDVRLDASFDARVDARFDGSIPRCLVASTLDPWFRGCFDNAPFDYANRSLASILRLSMLSSMLLASTARTLAWLLLSVVAWLLLGRFDP
jgi:hypothetical protein